MKHSLFLLMVMPLFSLFAACSGSDSDDDELLGGGTDSGSEITVTASRTEDGYYFDGALYYEITSTSRREVEVHKATEDIVTIDIPANVNIDGSIYKCTSISGYIYRYSAMGPVILLLMLTLVKF